MKTLFFFCLIAYVNAGLQLQNLLSSKWVDFGSYDSMTEIGNLTKPYLPLTKDDLTASANAAQFIEEARRLFKTGFYTMPPLDPYFRATLPTFVIDNHPMLKGSVVLSNFNMTGLIKFNRQLMEVRVNTGRVDYGFTVPQINVESDADIDILVADILPFRNSGKLRVVLKDVSLLGGVRAEPRSLTNKGFFQLTAQHNLLHAADTMGQFVPHRPHPQVNAIGYNFDTGDEWWQLLKERLDNYAATVVFNQANDILIGPTVDQILAYLVPDVR